MWQKIIFLLISYQVSRISSQSYISCAYGQAAAGQPYTCTLTINNPNGAEFDSILGEHKAGFGNQHVTALIANFQYTRNIPSVICRQFPNLVNVNMGSNQISILNGNSFGGCGALTFLTLAYNNIDTLPDNTFLGNRRLASVNLARNRIRTFFRESFTGTAVTTIDLSQNQITEIIQSSFCSVNTTLTTLILSYNSLLSLPGPAFGCLSGLQHLHLSGNRNIQIPSTAFPSLTNLITLNLRDCGFTTVDPGWFRVMQSLTEVHLEQNSIASLPGGVFAVSRNLKNVFLSDNRLTELTAAPFGANLSTIQMVIAYSNSIRFIERDFFDQAVNLRSLYLFGNVCSNENFEITSGNRNDVRNRLERCFNGL